MDKLEARIKLLDHTIDRQRKTIAGLREKLQTQEASLTVVFGHIDKQINDLKAKIKETSDKLDINRTIDDANLASTLGMLESHTKKIHELNNKVIALEETVKDGTT